MFVINTLKNTFKIFFNINLLYMDKKSTNTPIFDEQATNSFQSMIIFNDNLRKNIKLSLLIYKKLNNFEHNYIHEFFTDKSKTSSK